LAVKTFGAFCSASSYHTSSKQASKQASKQGKTLIMRQQQKIINKKSSNQQSIDTKKCNTNLLSLTTLHTLNSATVLGLSYCSTIRFGSVITNFNRPNDVAEQSWFEEGESVVMSPSLKLAQECW